GRQTADGSEFLGTAKGFFRPLAIRDVAGHAEMKSGAVAIVQRRAMYLHVAAHTVQADDVILQRALVAVADVFVEFSESFTMFRSNQWVNALSDDAIGICRAHNQKSRAVHQ